MADLSERCESNTVFEERVSLARCVVTVCYAFNHKLHTSFRAQATGATSLDPCHPVVIHTPPKKKQTQMHSRVEVLSSHQLSRECLWGFGLQDMLNTFPPDLSYVIVPVAY